MEREERGQQKKKVIVNASSEEKRFVVSCQSGSKHKVRVTLCQLISALKKKPGLLFPRWWKRIGG